LETGWHTTAYRLLSAVIAHQDQKLADYIDDYYYQILLNCVEADERLLFLTIELNSIS
jgi:hypothetical protein